MKVPLQQEILDLLKQKLLPEIGEMKAALKVINGRLELMDKRFDQVEEALHELRADVREVRSYVFASKMNEPSQPVAREARSGYGSKSVRRPPPRR